MAQAATSAKTKVQLLVDAALWRNITLLKVQRGLEGNAEALEAVLREFFKGWQFGPKAKG